MQVVISTAILLIATIIAASVFTAAALSELYTFQNTFKEVGSKNQAFYESSITIIGEAEAQSPGEGESAINVWVKNTGTTPFTITATGDPQYWDVFITFPPATTTATTQTPTSNRFPFYQISTSGGCSTEQDGNCFNVALLNGGSGDGTGTWETGDTIQLTITISQNPLPTGTYQVSLSLSNGVTAQDTFSL